MRVAGVRYKQDIANTIETSGLCLSSREKSEIRSCYKQGYCP